MEKDKFGIFLVILGLGIAIIFGGTMVNSVELFSYVLGLGMALVGAFMWFDVRRKRQIH